MLLPLSGTGSCAAKDVLDWVSSHPFLKVGRGRGTRVVSWRLTLVPPPGSIAAPHARARRDPSVCGEHHRFAFLLRAATHGIAVLTQGRYVLHGTDVSIKPPKKRGRGPRILDDDVYDAFPMLRYTPLAPRRTKISFLTRTKSLPPRIQKVCGQRPVHSGNRKRIGRIVRASNRHLSDEKVHWRSWG